METPFALLSFFAKMALRALGLGFGGELMSAVGPALLRDAWGGVCQWLGYTEAKPDSISVSVSLSVTPLGRDLERLAKAKPEDLKAAIKKAVKEVAADHPREVRQALAKYLAGVPAAIRTSWKRPDDPGGLSVPPDRMLVRPEDLLSFLPERLPVVSAASPAAPRERETADSARITLTAIAGEHQGKSFELQGHETFMVGRSQAAHFRLSKADRYFSRIHFMVEVNYPSCRLMDMGSRNGTFVNGRRVQGADLRDGDKIKAGRTILLVKIEAVAAVSAVPAAELARPAEVDRATRSMAPSSNAVCPACLGPVTPGSAPALCSACQKLAGDKPQPIPGYQIVRELGRGGMGIVYLAVRSADCSAVALKTITPSLVGSKAQVERFLREAAILKELDHPYIVAFRDLGEAAGMLYFAMDYVRGPDAGRILKNEGPLPISRALGLIGYLLQALDYAHAKGFVHRDIKPGNLLVLQKNRHPAFLANAATEGEEAFLADFGLARVYQASPLSGLTLQGDVAGTMAYMAPEQLTNLRAARPPVDQYAAAASLYHLLTGKLIFDLPKASHEKIIQILEDEPIPIQRRRPDVPAELAGVIHKALAKNPDDRFPSVGELRRALAQFA